MKWVSVGLFSLALASALSLPRPSFAVEAGGSTGGAEVERGGPNVVVIEVESARPSSGFHAPRAALGFVTESSGFVVTAYSPLVDPESGRLEESFRIRAHGAAPTESRPAEVVGVEPTLGFAVLRVLGSESLAPSRLRATGSPDPGTPIFAPTRVGGPDPMTLAGTLTALNTRECYQESLTSTLYQAALALPPEAAGAPVYTADGEVVALFTGATPEGGEAHEEVEGSVHLLPISLVRNIYESLKQKKSLQSPWTGFSVRPLTSVEARRFPTEKGFRSGIGIEFVWPGSPAAELGIRPGDILLQFSHNAINSVADFQKWLYLHGVGAEAKLVLLRGAGEHLVSEMRIEERPAWAKPR